MDIIAIYVTHKDMNNAEKVSDHLFRLKLIACVNYFPIQSVYSRKWSLEKSDEVVAIYKTKPQNRDKVQEAIKTIHPYHVPCIMKMPVEVNMAYGEWVMESVA